MFGRFQSKRVIQLCLLLALLSLFLRNLVYHDYGSIELIRADDSEPQLSGPIILAYHERPPYYITTSEQQLGGMIGEPAYRAMHMSGVPFTLREMPPQRQLELLENNLERLCGVGWFKNKAREQFGRFTQPIYQDKPIVVVTRFDLPATGQEIALEDILSDSSLTLLTRTSYSYGAVIDNAISHHRPELFITSGTTDSMLEMIHSKRGDYFLSSSEEAEVAIEAHPSPELFQILHPTDVPAGDKRYLMCSQQVTDEEITAINQAITDARIPDTGFGVKIP